MNGLQYTVTPQGFILLPLVKTSRFCVFDRPKKTNSSSTPGDKMATHKKVAKQPPLRGSTDNKRTVQSEQRLPPTERLYMLDTYNMAAVATVLGVVGDEAQLWSHGIILDRTVFHPQGGGQPSDSGVITCGSWLMQVDMVRDVGGVIHHYGKASGGTPSAGDSATLAIDAAKRKLHAALHSAGHAIDRAVVETVGTGVLKPLKGYHFADSPYVEYQGKLPNGLEKDVFVHKLNEELGSLVAADAETKVEVVSNVIKDGVCQRMLECDVGMEW